ncbi:MAG: tRNA-dihydrouridine synthase [Clostridiales bacterium]|nr:tRNA-dihydrouridine synthase [Clostridiales bacterium]
MKFYMAPLEEITGYVYRNAYRDFFYPMDKYFSPFIAAKPNQGRLFNYKEKNDILPEHNQNLYLVPQILTNSSRDFIKTARGLKEYGYGEINLNLGCPSKPVVNRGRGSGFLSRKEELNRFLEEIFENPVTKISIKTRLGTYDPEEIGPLLEIFRQYPLEELIIHPRIQSDFYRGKPRMEGFTAAYQKKICPLCYNGDIFSAADYEKLQREFPEIDRVMLGRGVLADPGLVGRIHGRPGPDREVWKAFLRRLCEDFRRISVDEQKALFKMKELWCYFRFSFPESDVWNWGIKRARSLEEYEDVVERLFETYPCDPAGQFPGHDTLTEGKYSGK